MNAKSPIPMFLLGGVCVFLIILLSYSMPHGPPPREPDGSILMSTVYQYERQTWKAYSIMGGGIAAPVLLALGAWRWFHRKKATDAQVTTA